MNPIEQEEYTALRATIQARGTTRVWIFVVAASVWAALTLAMVALTLPPVAALVPLIVLAAAFEAVFALHVGVERIGRYLEVFHQDRWERTAMAFGTPLAGTRSDPLFVLVFAGATILNLFPVFIAGPLPVELAVIGAAHAIFIGRLARAHLVTGRQRLSDLARFKEIQSSESRSNK